MDIDIDVAIDVVGAGFQVDNEILSLQATESTPYSLLRGQAVPRHRFGASKWQHCMV
jgi:hypothetical protein